MKAFFKVDIDVIVKDDWAVDDLKMALAEWAQLHDAVIEGLIRQVISLDVRDTDYFRCE